MGVPISSLPAAAALTGAELLPVVQSGTTKRSTTDAIPYLPAGTGAVATTVQSKLRETVSVKDFGAVGDGVTDDTAAIQAAFTYINSLGGGCVVVPAGNFKCSSSVTIPKNTVLSGLSRATSKLTYTGTGDFLKSTSAINSSTAANIQVRSLSIVCSNASNTGGGFVDLCGTFVDVFDCYITGFKHQVIFDQTEIATIDKCWLIANIAGGSNIWLVNGPDRVVGVLPYFTNRITITRNELNAAATATANIIDDGGINHSIRDNNFNAGLIGLRAAGVSALVVSGNESEAHGDCDIYLADTTNSGTSVTPCKAPDICGNTLVSIVTANVKVQNCVGGSIRSNEFGQATAGISLLSGAFNRASGIIIEGNTKLVNGTYRTAGVFVDGFSGPIAAQVIRQGACTYVAASQGAGGTFTVTPATMEFIYPGTKLFAANDNGTLSELITVTSVTGTTFTAVFSSAKSANYTLVGVGVSAPTSGTFTPVVVGTGTAGTGTYTTQQGFYTRVGNCVYFTINLVWTAHTGTTNMYVSGLPFTPISSVTSPVACYPTNIALTAGNYMVGYVYPGSKQVWPLQVATGTTGLNLVPMDTAGELNFSGHYFSNDA